MSINEVKMLMENSRAMVTILQDLTISVGGVTACLSALKQINEIPNIKDLSKKELAKEIARITGKEITKYGTACALVLTAPYFFNGVAKILESNVVATAISKVKIIKELPFIVK